MLGLVVGFVNQLVLAALFGAGAEMDAYLAATTLPMLAVTVLLGSLNFTFIPVFIEYTAKQNVSEAWKIASTLINSTILLLGVIAIIGIWLAPFLISATVPGFTGERYDLSVSLMRFLWPTVVFNGLIALLSGIYNSQGRFAIPALAPVIGTIITLVIVLLASGQVGIKALGIGTLVASIVQVAILAPILFGPGRYRFCLEYRNSGFRKILVLMVPLLLGSIVYRATSLLDRFIASSLPEGTIAYLGYASRISSIFLSLISPGISIAIFPLMANKAAMNEFAALRKVMSSGIRIMLAMVMPVVVLGSIMAVPLVGLLFERGRFDHSATEAVGVVLPWYLLALIGGSLGNIVGRGYYVLKDTKTSAILGVIEVLVYTVFLVFLVDRFSYLGIGIATALYYTLSIFLDGFVVRHKIGGQGGGRILAAAFKITTVSVLSGVIVYFVLQLTAMNYGSLLAIVIGGLTGLSLYVVFGKYLLKIEEISEVLSVLRSSLIKKMTSRAAERLPETELGEQLKSWVRQ